MGVSPNRSAGKRAWYPSGPRLDGSRSGNSYGSALTEVNINPQPDNWEILDSEEIGNFLLLKIKYPNCTNYEGIKILVFKDVKAIDLLKQKLIDPHFFQDKKIKSPIARFVPTDEGWKMAQRFAKLHN